jgi:uncharacterized protein (DUF849 family)
MDNIRTATSGILMGTHLRVGQEDNLYEHPGKPFKSNAEQVEKISRICGELGIEVANAKEARQMLNFSAG